MKLFRILALAVVFFAAFSFAEEVAEEAAQPDRNGFSEEERQQVDAVGEKHEFQAEVNRLMDIIINSLYSNREIFVRELISNAADASDKMRFQGLQDKESLGEGDLAELDIKIQFDKEKKTLTFTDKGIGMTKDQLISNLGIVAKSGTTEFLEAAQAGNADQLSLIGQFGVGFYSVYLVADKVTVVSKNNADKQFIWESTANSVFTVAEDPRGNTLGRGTSVTLHLKEDAEEFLAEAELEKIITRYSQFVNVPIYLYTTKTVSKEVPIEEDKAEEKTEEEPKAEGDDDLEVSEEEEGEEKDDAPKTKTVQETVNEWKRINEAKAIWTRAPKEISDEEYSSFFKTLTKDKYPEGALDHIHFVAEGEISFKSLLYIPREKEGTQYNDLFSLKKTGVHLYVRRVLISDEFEDFLPRYMNFVRGVVDSDDLPLNVSRETLAQSRVLKVMSKKLVRKILEMLRKMAQAGEKKSGEEDEEEAEKAEGEEGEEEAEVNKDYEIFWEEHGKSIKFGVIDDRKNKSKLTKLLRYKTSASDGKAVSLESYVDRMKEGQKYMYFMTGETMDKIKNSPFLEKVTSKGFEVVYMDDPLDEYVVGSMTEFDGIELQSVTKEGLKLGDEDRKSLKKLKEEYKPLTEWFKGVYGDKVEKVVVSNRLGQSPLVLVTGQYGWSANMQRIVQGSTLQTAGANSFLAAKKTLEINVHHPIMQALTKRIDNDAEEESLKDLALMLLDSAIMSSGFTITDYTPFNKRMSRVVSAGLGLDPNAPVEEEPDDVAEEESEEKDEAEEAAKEEEEVEEAVDETAKEEEAVDEAEEEGAKPHEDL